MNDIKQAGLCTLCNKPVFEILKKYPQSHPLAGRIRQVGKPLDVVKATFVLPKSQIDLTYCKDCKLTPEAIRSSWDKVLNSWVEDISDEHREKLNMEPLSEKQRETSEKWILEMVDVFPVLLGRHD